jgi:hypothetical protein
MSGQRQTIEPGYVVTDELLQRIADQAALGADLEMGALLRTGANGGVLPLGMRLLGRLDYPTESGQVAAKLVGSTRRDLAYLTLTRTSTTASRKFKDPTTGEVSTQTLPWYSDVSVTINIAQGTAGGAAATLPADTATAWNLPLCWIDLPAAAYALGGALDQDWITQCWERAWFEPVARTYEKYTVGAFDATIQHATTLDVSTRNPANLKIAVPVKLLDTAPTGSYAGAVLDTRHDWRGRMVRFSVIGTGLNGGARGALDVSDVPSDLHGTSQWMFVGHDVSGATVGVDIGGTNGAVLVKDASAAATRHAHLEVNASGHLKFHIKPLAGNAVTAGGEYYWVEVEASHPFVGA